MALRAIHGNSADALLDALIAALPPSDPFEPTTIVIGSHVIGRWLRRELALRRGVAAGLDLLTFDRFVERTWGHPDLVALDRDQLAAAVASVLADPRAVAELPAVAAYLHAAPAAGDRAGPRRVQLAEHVAHLVWNYALARPSWMPALIAGRLPSDLEGDDTARWQAALIGEAMRRLTADATGHGGRRAAPTPMLPWLRRRAELPAPELAKPIAIFGASYLVRSQLEALTALAMTSDVAVYMLDPCEELWDDVAGRARATASDDPLLLGLWGRAVRSTVGALVERTDGDIDGAFVTPARPATTALQAMLADVRARRLPAEHEVASAGVTILACPGERREIEAVAARLRGLLDADPSLRAHELAVWIAGDAERYLAQAPSAFEAVGVPCHLIDAPIDDRGRIGEAVLALLELPSSEMTRGDLLRVMTHPAVLAAHPHVDIADWVRWTEALGIVHGADADAHRGTYLADHPDKFHWDQGVRRLALGAYMSSATVDRRPATIGELEVMPEVVRADQLASAATYALLVRSLAADAAWLVDHEATLAEWADVLVGLVDAYIERGATNGETSRDVERVRAMLAGLARVDLDGRRVGFREAREHAVRKLVGARADRGEPLAAGVMIAPLRAHRAVPFKISCVVGLAEGEFPAHDQPSPLDLRRDVQAGDISPRDADRHAFFEVLLGARDHVFLSYVAAEPKSGQPLGPSSVVLELGDALAPYLGAESSRAALAKLTVHEPLHRWNATSASPIVLPSAALPAIQRERWAARVRDAVHAHLRAHDWPIPDDDGMLALLAHPSCAHLRAELGVVDGLPDAAAPAAQRQLSLANLRAFLESPVQAWAQAVLDLDELPDDTVVDHSDEPFHLEKPARAILLREVLAGHLMGASAHGSLAESYDAVVRELALRGQFPVGVFGEAARAVDLRTLERWRDELGLVAIGSATRYGFGRSQSEAAELLPALELSIGNGRTVRLVGSTELLIKRGNRMLSVIAMIGNAEKSSRHHLRGALDHVVLAAAGMALEGHEHVLLSPTAAARRVSHEPWMQADARAYLIDLVRELVDQPHGYLLPFDMLRRSLEGRTASAAKQRFDVFPALGFGPIERPDGLGAPADPIAIAKRRLGPLAERMRGDHSFGGGDE